MRPIDADALFTPRNVRKVTEYDETGCGIDYLAVPWEVIQNAPTLDYAPVRHSEWIMVSPDGSWGVCKACNRSDGIDPIASLTATSEFQARSVTVGSMRGGCQMKTPDETKKGLFHCTGDYSAYHCGRCDYAICGRRCDDNGVKLLRDALAYIQQLEAGQWDLFFEITSAYYGKQMYGINDDGTVYSRYSCKEMTFEQAVKEFKELISGE